MKARAGGLSWGDGNRTGRRGERPAVSLPQPAGSGPPPWGEGRQEALFAGSLGRGSRSVPGHRAVLGGLLIAAAAVIVFAVVVAAASRHDRSWLVAARNLPAGTVIGPGDTTTARLGLSGATADSAFGQESAVIGRTLTVPLSAGQLIEAPMLAPTSPAGGLRPVSIPVDADSLASVAPGDQVDVLALPGSSSGAASSGSAPTMATVVLRGATLVSESRGSSGLLAGSPTAVVVTIGVSDLAEAQAVEAASHAGTVELVLAEPGDGTGPGPGPTGAGTAGFSSGTGNSGSGGTGNSGSGGTGNGGSGGTGNSGANGAGDSSGGAGTTESGT
jgi:Flp pilus assembly protein CpaB